MIDFTEDLKTIDNHAIRLLADEVYQELIDGKQDCIVDIGIGKLNIHLDDTVMNFKFIPCDAMIEKLEGRLSKNREVLVEALESKVVHKFLDPVEEIYP